MPLTPIDPPAVRCQNPLCEYTRGAPAHRLAYRAPGSPYGRGVTHTYWAKTYDGTLVWALPDGRRVKTDTRPQPDVAQPERIVAQLVDWSSRFKGVRLTAAELNATNQTDPALALHLSPDAGARTARRLRGQADLDAPLPDERVLSRTEAGDPRNMRPVLHHYFTGDKETRILVQLPPGVVELLPDQLVRCPACKKEQRIGDCRE